MERVKTKDWTKAILRIFKDEAVNPKIIVPQKNVDDYQYSRNKMLVQM